MLSKLLGALRRVVQFRVRRWHTSMRGWNEKNARVLVNCETDIWYWVLAEIVFWEWQTHLCSALSHVSLPGFVLRIKGHWDKSDPKYRTSLEDWFGDNVGSLWHIFVCDPCLQFVWRHKNRDEAQFELTLDEARQKFAHDPEQYRWVERSVEEHKRWDAEKVAEIRAAYRSGKITREQAIDKLSFWLDLENDKTAEILDKQDD